MKTYQRKYLRAPFKQPVLFADQNHVHKAYGLNLSQGGLYLDYIPCFSLQKKTPLMFSLYNLPVFKNFSLNQLKAINMELFGRNIIYGQAQFVRQEDYPHKVDNILKARFGVEFVDLRQRDQQLIDHYIKTYTDNIIYLQTLIDTFNSDPEAQVKIKTIAPLLGYQDIQKIALLRVKVNHDYQSLVWS